MEKAREDVARTGLDALKGHGFALAGASASELHGLISRPTRDLDLFTNLLDKGRFEQALEELQGPDHGTVELPVSVHWGPKSTFRVDSSEVLAHYAYVLNAGTIDDLRTILNRTVLEQSWAALLLPARCRRLWEEKFPQLAA